MQLSILVDNNTIIDRYFHGEPAVSYFIKSKGASVLFDVGYSEAFLRNAAKISIEPLAADYVVLSHGHIDHTGGLDPLLKESMEARFEGRGNPIPEIIAHPELFYPKYWEDGSFIGSPVSENVLKAHFKIRKKRAPLQLGEELYFLGEIERTNNFENREPVGTRETAPGSGGDLVPDYLPDDTALAYAGREGLTIITGCSHAGICNIVTHARKVTGVDRVVSIIGGLHLLNPSMEVLEKTCSFLKELNLERLCACHCTDFRSRVALAQAAPLEEVGSGLVLDFE